MTSTSPRGRDMASIEPMHRNNKPNLLGVNELICFQIRSSTHTDCGSIGGRILLLYGDQAFVYDLGWIECKNS